MPLPPLRPRLVLWVFLPRKLVKISPRRLVTGYESIFAPSFVPYPGRPFPGSGAESQEHSGADELLL